MVNTFGAPAAARTCAGHAGEDSSVVRPITPGKASPAGYSMIAILVSVSSGTRLRGRRLPDHGHSTPHHPGVVPTLGPDGARARHPVRVRNASRRTHGSPPRPTPQDRLLWWGFRGSQAADALADEPYPDHQEQHGHHGRVVGLQPGLHAVQRSAHLPWSDEVRDDRDRDGRRGEHVKTAMTTLVLSRLSSAAPIVTPAAMPISRFFGLTADSRKPNPKAFTGVN